jgi:hypothetical protein
VPVVTLDSLNSEAELSGLLGKEVDEGGKCLKRETGLGSPALIPCRREKFNVFLQP